MSEFKGIHQDRLKLHFVRPEGEISRRELLKLVLPRYEVVPFIEATLCRGYQECGLCLDICPLKAVKVEEGEVTIDTALCSGCGACVEACPYRAILYPTFSLEELDKKMKSLLLTKGTAPEPKVIAAVCERCLLTGVRDVVAQASYSGNMLPLKVPCLAMVSPWLILRAFNMGAQGFALISGRGKCRSGFDSTRWQENVRFPQGLLNCWGIETGRIRVFDTTKDEPGSIERKWNEFAEEMVGLGHIPLSMSEPTMVPEEGLRLPALVKSMIDKLGNPPKGSVLDGVVPFGKVKLDGSRCTSCGLCALNCPTEALTVSSNGETDVYQLLFKHDICMACGRCVEVCPEKCLRLERILELDKIDSSATVLFEDIIVRCSECGSPIGSRALINNVKAKVLATGRSSPSQFELCPICKMKAQFSYRGSSEVPKTH